MTVSTDTTVDPAPTTEDQSAAQQPESAEAAAPQPDDPDTKAKPEDTPEESEADKTIRRMQRRIDRLTARNGARDYQLAQLQTELQRLMQQPAGDEPAQPQQPSESDLRTAIEQRAAQLRELERTQERVERVLDAGAKIAGFDAACNAVNEEVPFYVIGADGTKRPTAFTRAVLDAERPHELLLYLGNNLDEAAKFEGLTPEQIGRRIAHLEAKVREASKQKPSAAPKPLQPVAARGNSTEPTDTDSLNDWMRKEIARLNARNGHAARH